MTQDDITRIVSEVLKKLDSNPGFRAAIQGAPQAQPRREASASGGGVYQTVTEAVEAAEKAQPVFQDMGIEARKKIIDAIRQAAVSNAERFAKMAQEETGMGRWQDKLQKNLICALKTPGVEDLSARAYTGDKGLTLVEYAPFGVVAAITPSTNPVATVISNAIAILAAGNSVVFSPHPASKKSVQEAIRVFNAAAVAAGAPPDLMTTMASPTQDSTKELLSHPKARMNLVTGGPAIVRVAMTTGKTCKVIAAGPGNPPVVVDETARFPECAESIITGCGFDNNVLCIAEKEVIVVEAAREKFLAAMRADKRAYELSPEQMDQLAKAAIPDYQPGKEPRVNRDFVGKNPSHIAKAIGLSLSDDVRVLWGVTPNDHPFVMAEQLMPVLPVTFVPNLDAAIELAYRAEGGNHHSAAMYSMNVENLTKMGRRIACSIYVKNAPTLYGLGMGEGYASMSIGTPTGDGITKPTHFVRPLHCVLVGYFRIA